MTARTPAPTAAPPGPDLTPAPALLKALAHVGEVDLAKGLGPRRLAELVRATGPLARPRRWTWLVAAALLAAAAILLALR